MPQMTYVEEIKKAKRAAIKAKYAEIEAKDTELEAYETQTIRAIQLIMDRLHLTFEEACEMLEYDKDRDGAWFRYRLRKLWEKAN